MGSEANRKKCRTHWRNELHLPSKIVGIFEKSCSRGHCGWISWKQLWSFSKRILYSCRYFIVLTALMEKKIITFVKKKHINFFVCENYQICSESPLRVWKYQHFLLFFTLGHSSLFRWNRPFEMRYVIDVACRQWCCPRVVNVNFIIVDRESY